MSKTEIYRVDIFDTISEARLRSQTTYGVLSILAQGYRTTHEIGDRRFLAEIGILDKFLPELHAIYPDLRKVYHFIRGDI